VRASRRRAVGPSDDTTINRADVAAEQGALSYTDGDADLNADDTAFISTDASPDDRAHRGANRSAFTIPFI